MFRKLIIASMLAFGGLALTGTSAEAGHPRDCGYDRFHHHHAYHGAYRLPYSGYYRDYSPYVGPYGYSSFRAYRPAVGIGVGAVPFGYGYPYGAGYRGFGPGVGGFGGYGSGFSLYIGR